LLDLGETQRRSRCPPRPPGDPDVGSCTGVPESAPLVSLSPMRRAVNRIRSESTLSLHAIVHKAPSAPGSPGSIRSYAVGATTPSGRTPPGNPTARPPCPHQSAWRDAPAPSRNSRPGQSTVWTSRWLEAACFYPLRGNIRAPSGGHLVTATKIMGKPCAEKPYARIQRGTGKQAHAALHP
jgi:hypothetical protein